MLLAKLSTASAADEKDSREVLSSFSSSLHHNMMMMDKKKWVGIIKWGAITAARAVPVSRAA